MYIQLLNFISLVIISGFAIYFCKSNSHWIKYVFVISILIVPLSNSIFILSAIILNYYYIVLLVLSLYTLLFNKIKNLLKIIGYFFISTFLTMGISYAVIILNITVSSMMDINVNTGLFYLLSSLLWLVILTSIGWFLNHFFFNIVSGFIISKCRQLKRLYSRL